MKITLEAMVVLDAIDRKGSFSGAAEELFKVPSAITYTVQKLEQDLGVKIFNRKGYRATLTDAGRELLESGRHVLRAVTELESRVQRVATGWESELVIAVDTILEIEPVLELCEQFYAEESGTRVRLLRECYGGSWDAIVSGRADLVIGAPSDAPTAGEYIMRELGHIEMVFAVSPDHPLAMAPEPLDQNVMRDHRAVAVADSSRTLPPRTGYLMSGQDVFTVPDMPTKILAHKAGIGGGFLPRYLIEKEIENGELIVKAVSSGNPTPSVYALWSETNQGKALQWFVQKLTEQENRSTLSA